MYLGVDGGQSSTIALIGDETGRVLGRGRGGPCNHVSGAESRTKFFDALTECLTRACAEAHLDSKAVTFACACLGFSGGPEDKEAYSRELIRSMQYKITHDAEIALAGATVGEPGIIIIAGTGSMAFGRNAEGQTARAGGWGYIFGDEGGAFDTVRRALRAALQYEEGWGPPTILRDLLLKETGVANANELLHVFYTPAYTHGRVASLCPLVTRAAEEADSVALEIFSTAAAELARFVEGVHRHLFRAGDPVPLGYIGGTFQSAPLLASLRKRIRDSIASKIGPPRLSPAAGALLEALRMDGNQAQLSAVPESEK
ncbi:MAG: BadF/BadG/BcrA/BcrD ATPase family protein [Bryobacteraceae bacterium]